MKRGVINNSVRKYLRECTFVSEENIDMKIIKELQGLKSPDGTLATWNHLNPDSWDPSAPVKFYGSNYWYNFYTWQKLHDNQARRDRLFGDVSLNYKVLMMLFKKQNK